MTELIMIMLSSGGGEYISKAILIGLFFIFPYQIVLKRRVLLNPLSSISLWVLAFFGFYFSMVGFSDLESFKRFLLAPVLLFFSGWIIIESCKSWLQKVDKIKNVVLGIMVGYSIHALLNYFLNIGKERWNLMDYYTGTYRAATGLGVINTIAFSTFIYCILEKNNVRKIMGLVCFGISALYGLQVGSRTQLLILVIVTVISLVFYFCEVDNRKAARWTLALSIVVCIVFLGIYQMNLFGIRRMIELSNLFYRVNANTSHGDSVRFSSILRGLNSLIEYPMGNASQFYFHNMWLDAGRVSGIVAFLLIFVYTVLTYRHAFSVIVNKKISIEFRVLILGVYLGLLINYFVEPVLEGMTDNFYVFCLINGALECLFTTQRRHPEILSAQ